MTYSHLPTLHDVAMEFVDEARFAAERGDDQTARLFLQKAFNLEKMFALAIPDKGRYLLTRSVFLRSAATLALESNFYEEAINLANMALQQPHPAIKEELLDILDKATKQKLKKNGSLHITGTLVAADIPGSRIKIRGNDDRKLFTVQVPSENIDEMVKKFWDNIVDVKAKQVNNGLFFLENIQKAA